MGGNSFTESVVNSIDTIVRLPEASAIGWASNYMEMNRLVDIAKKTGGLTLNVIFRKYDDGIVAECLEIPGCLAQSDTEQEVKINIADAIESCLAVILEDAVKAAGASAHTNFVGIEKQETVEIDIPRILPSACAS
jgi:predicted RNase H-like HicB family nuclease